MRIRDHVSFLSCFRVQYALTTSFPSLFPRARDRPEKKLGIEIYNCIDYQRMRFHWNGCGLILHELSHLIHQLILPDGLENIAVKEAFACAKASEKYEQVLRRDWAGKEIDCDLAYAMVDHREFFAEMSVTYLSSRGYRELDHAIHSKMIKASPPIVAPSVHSNIALHRDQFQKWLGDGKLVNVRKTMTLSHCNKFVRFQWTPSVLSPDRQCIDGSLARSLTNFLFFQLVSTLLHAVNWRIMTEIRFKQ